MARLNRRAFMKAAGAGAAAGAWGLHWSRRFAFAATAEPIKIGFPLPQTGPFGALAKEQQEGAVLAMEEINAKGGVLGRKLEIIFRDDQLKSGEAAKRAKELIENEKVHFMAGAIGAHTQMAVNEQTKKAKVLYVSLSQSDEITAKPDWSPWTFHEAMNPSITSKAIGTWAFENLGKRWWILYADYAFGRQNMAGFQKVAAARGGIVLGTTPYPLGSTDFSAFLPKIREARPEVLVAVTPGKDQVNSFKQIHAFGLKKEMKLIAPLMFFWERKEAGADPYAGVYSGTSFYWELADAIPSAKRFVEAFSKRWGYPPGDYAGYGYSGIREVARGIELANSLDGDKVAAGLRGTSYDHYKGRLWWRACDNKAFQDVYILRGRDPEKVKGGWGFFDIVAKIPASEELDRTCAEKGHA